MDRIDVLLMQVTKMAAIAASLWSGKGDAFNADKAAVDAMRKALNSLDIDGTVVVGEGERDRAPMLYVGEKVGLGSGIVIDIAVDPLEGTDICASYGAGALSVLAFAEKGKIITAPDVYMEKIIVGGIGLNDMISLSNDLETNIRNLSDIKKKEVDDLEIIVLKRPRHEELIKKIRKIGAKVLLINDGDIEASLLVLRGNCDAYMGIGGAPEGVISSVIARLLGGVMDGRFILKDPKDLLRAQALGVDADRIYKAHDLCNGDDCGLVMTGVTSGNLLGGIIRNGGVIRTHSMVVRNGRISEIIETIANGSEVTFGDGKS